MKPSDQDPHCFLLQLKIHTCADPGFFTGDGQKTAWTTFFVFLVLNIFYSLQRGYNGFITEKTIIFQGSNIFRGGGGGPHMAYIQLECYRLAG